MTTENKNVQSTWRGKYTEYNTEMANTISFKFNFTDDRKNTKSNHNVILFMPFRLLTL